MKNIIASIIWVSIGIIIVSQSLFFYFLYAMVTWTIYAIIYSIIEAKKTTGGKGVNRTVDKGTNPFNQ